MGESIADQVTQNIAAAGRPPRLRTIYTLGLLAGFMTAALLFKAGSRAAHPLPNWMTGTTRWYDDLLSALVWAGLCIACVAYARYRRRLVRLGRIAAPRAWCDRREVRAVLYLFACVQIAQFPIAVWRTVVALNDPSSAPFATSFLSAFPVQGMAGPLAGIAAFLYDRRRLQREQREQREADNLCLVCGYDLRATPDRCPECGSVRQPSLSTPA